MARSVRRTLSFFALLALPAALSATPNTEPAAADPLAVMDQVVDQAMVVMFEAGATDPNWNKGGADALQDLRSKPGHVLLDVDKDGERTVIYFPDQPVAGTLPAEWELLTEIGQIDGEDANGLPVEISEIEDGYYSVSRSRYERVGDAHCSSAPEAVRLYKRKGASQADMSDNIFIAIFRTLVERTEGKTICERTEVKDGVYSSRYFLKNGQSLPFFDARSGTATLVPQRSIAEMLSKPEPKSK